MPWVARFPRYQDPWLDNGLETLYDMVVQAGAASPVEASIEQDTLRLIFPDLDAAVGWLDRLIVHRSEAYLRYDVQTRENLIASYLHRHVVFGGQPATQWPILFRGKGDAEQLAAARRELLRTALLTATDGAPAEPGASGRPSSRGRRRAAATCPFCGVRSEQAFGEMTQSLYPLATKTAALSGPRKVPGGSRQLLSQTYQKACARCQLIGSLGWVDGGFLFHTFKKGPNGQDEVSRLMLPDPPGRSLGELHRLKRRLREVTVRRERRTNLILPRSPVESAAGRPDGWEPPGTSYGLLLAYTEQALLSGARFGEDLWSDEVQVVPEQWVELVIPGGRMKNLKLIRHRLGSAFLKRAAAWLEAGVRPAGWLLELDLVRADSKPLAPDRRRQAVRSRQEALAQALVQDRFTLFAGAFVPRGGLLVRPRSPWTPYLQTLQALLRLWRREHEVTAEQLELLRRGGQSLGRVAVRQISLVYTLERARRYPDLLDVLAQVGHFLAGAKEDELEYISLKALDELTQLVATEALPLEEIRNTLVVFAALEVARQRMLRAGRAAEGGRTQEVNVDAS